MGFFMTFSYVYGRALIILSLVSPSLLPLPCPLPSPVLAGQGSFGDWVSAYAG